MNKLILHAGLHKTGTSAIQKTLSNNRDFLWENGYFYPDPLPFDAHHAFASRLRNITNLEAKVEEVERQLVLYKKNAKGRAVLLSSEIFSEQIDPLCFRTLPNIFDEVHIAFYIRQQDELVESAYNQQIKQSRECRSIDEYRVYRWDIYQHLKNFSDAIKGSNVYALEYNYEVFVDEDLNADFFFRVLGLPFNTPHLSQNIVTNESISVASCAILARLNKLPITDDQRIKAMEVLISELPVCDYTQYGLLSDKARLELMKKSEVPNKYLRRDFLRSGEFKYTNKGKLFLNSMRLNKIIHEKDIVNKLSVMLNDAWYNLSHELKF
jgi:hypothetical protein